jgi:hypothetical protein
MSESNFFKACINVGCANGGAGPIIPTGPVWGIVPPAEVTVTIVARNLGDPNDYTWFVTDRIVPNGGATPPTFVSATETQAQTATLPQIVDLVWDASSTGTSSWWIIAEKDGAQYNMGAFDVTPV